MSVYTTVVQSYDQWVCSQGLGKRIDRVDRKIRYTKTTGNLMRLIRTHCSGNFRNFK